jgi:DNA-binding NarL/FixJ family response regulator
MQGFPEGEMRRTVGDMASAAVEVLLVDDDAIVRSWLRASLAGSEFRVAGEAATLDAAVDLLARRHIDVLLVDFHLAGTSGVELLRDLRGRGILTAAVVMTASPEPGLNETAREAGAQGVMLKSARPEDMLAALRAVAAGESSFDPAHPPRPTTLAPLGRREREVLTLIGSGLTNREIAERLELGEETVKTHLERVYAKLGVSRRAEAVAAAHRLGLLGH